MEIDNDYIKWAIKYAKEHKSVVSILEPYKEGSVVYLKTTVFVNLPSKYKQAKQTARGINEQEEVIFEFPSNFPYKAPKIYLRDNFNRDFPHINPISDKLNPCVFEGSMDELLQQPRWIDGIIDQLIDWLENAAAESMINPSQGWEPMRVDDNNGSFFYDKNILFNSYNNYQKFDFELLYKKYDDDFFALLNVNVNPTNKLQVSNLLTFTSAEVSNNYLPGKLKTFSDLCNYARSNNILKFREAIDENFSVMVEREIKYIFISLMIKRPYHLIGSIDDKEVLYFSLEVKPHNKHPNKIHQGAKVYILSGVELANTDILKQFSGAKHTTIESNIIQIGCGSLGSKIIMHLARNGNDNIHLIDNKLFFPNNNARHALFNRHSLESKVNLLKMAMSEIGLHKVSTDPKNIYDIEDLNSADGSIIIDSTASLAINHYLNNKEIVGRLIHTSLYNNGTIALMCIEGKNRSVKTLDIIAHLYQLCIVDTEIAKRITDTHAEYHSLGQGCGSFTTICSDATISLSSAGISNKIQSCIDKGFRDNGELLIGISDNELLGMSWKRVTFPSLIEDNIVDSLGVEWKVRVHQSVIDEINQEVDKWGELETGGILLGHISLSTHTIVITGQIKAPEDSKRGVTSFYSGIKGLEQKLLEIEKATASMITQIGTWHSHPNSSSTPSKIDLDSKNKMEEDRKGIPTACLIHGKNSISIY